MIIIPSNTGKAPPVVIKGVSSGVMPTHAAGDLLLAFPYANGYIPSTSSGWTSIASGGGGNGYRINAQWKIATSSSETFIGTTVVLGNGKSIGNYTSIVTIQAAASFGPPNPFYTNDPSGNSQVIGFFCGQGDVFSSNTSFWSNLDSGYQQATWKARSDAPYGWPSAIYTWPVSIQYSNCVVVEVMNK